MHRSNHKFAIAEHNGKPTLFISGKPEFPMFLFQQEITEKDARAFWKAGFKFYSFIELTSCLDLGWVDDYKSDFSTIDRVLKTTVDRVPDGLLLPRIHVWAPEWWLDKYPDQAIGFALSGDKRGDIWGGKKHESFASDLWLEQAGEALRRMVRHILDGPYANNVMGIHIASGVYGEWHSGDPFGVPDTSEPMRQAFVSYARNKYSNSLSDLRGAWGDSEVTFDTISVPSLEERRTGDMGVFRDPSRSCRVIDYYECYHKVTVKVIDHLCRIVKEESNDNLLTCVLYGYCPDVNWPQEGDHRGAALAHRLKNVDMFSTPHTYARRNIGGDGAFRNFTGSLALHGKLFLDEGDDRTHLSGPLSTPGVYAKSVDESRQILWRAFANVVCDGVGMWFMDQSSGKWYDDPDIRADFEAMKKWADYSMQLPREWASEVAVITSMESEFYLCGRDSGTNHISYVLYRRQLGELSRSGAPFSRYLIEDLEAGLIPPHKVYIFLDCFYLTPKQREAIEKLKNDNRSLVWFYAPGFVSDNRLSLEKMESLTGMKFNLDPTGNSDLEMQLDPRTFPGGPFIFGPTEDQVPIFYPLDEGIDMWGRFTDHGGYGVVAKQFDSWRSIYCPVPALPSVALRKVYAEAGVHNYLDTDDNVVANQSWIGIHAVSSGAKTIKLPHRSPVFDVINNKIIGENTDEFTINMDAGTTALYVKSLCK